MECFKNGKCVLQSPWNVLEHFVQKRVRTLLLQKGQNEKGPLGKKKQPVITNCGRVINTVMFWWLQASFRACLHEAGGPQVGEVTRLGGVTRLSIQSLILMWSRLHVRWGNPPRVTSPTWGPPPSCKQALSRCNTATKKCTKEVCCTCKVRFFLLFRLINFFVVLVAVAVQHYTILFFVYVESFAFSPGPYYENLFFVIGACRVLTVSPLSNTSDGLRCGSAMVEQVWFNKPLKGVG